MISQLAYSFEIALQNEFSLEENIALARQFVSGQFVGWGMIVGFAIHLPDKENGGILFVDGGAIHRRKIRVIFLR